MDHAVIQPSSAARWVQCPGSLVMERIFPESDSEAAKEGQLAHSVAAAMFGHGTILPGTVTEEMQDGAELFYDDVMTVVKRLNSHVNPVIEQRINCFEIHPECWGTPDVVLLDIALNELHIWDYKFGHRYVDVFENWQLLCYAIGKLANHGTATLETLKVHLHIVQPRSYHRDGPCRTWVVDALKVRDYAAQLQHAAALAMLQDPMTFTGPECRDCKARHACPTLQGLTYEAVQLSGQASPFELTPDAMGRELATLLSAADVLKARISGHENELMALLKRGTPSKGWTLEQGMGRKKWDRPVDEIVALGDMLGVNVSKPGVMTPPQAIKAGIPAAVVEGYTTVPHGEIKLVRDGTATTRSMFNVA